MPGYDIEHTAACRNGDKGVYHVKQKIADMDYPNQPKKNPSSLISLVACMDTLDEVQKRFPFAKFTDPMWDLPDSSGYYAVERR
jgi:hypothetical protein